MTRAYWRRHVEIAALLKKHGATCQPADIIGSKDWYEDCLKIGQ